MAAVAAREKKNNLIVGMLFFMATVTMLFAGTISALLIRRASSDWTAIYFPPILLMNTAIIILSSVTLELARIYREKSSFWMTATTVFGFLFLIGQVIAWKLLALHGVFLPSNPHASFFYILTGLHGLHLLGGLILLASATVHARRSTLMAQTLTLCRMYWHFLTILWLYLLVVLF